MGRWLALVLVAAVAGAFAWANRGETSIVHLGVVTLYRVPVSLLTFLAFLAGMAAMLVLGLRHDLRVRRALRDAGLLDAPQRPSESVGPPPAESTGSW